MAFTGGSLGPHLGLEVVPSHLGWQVVPSHLASPVVFSTWTEDGGLLEFTYYRSWFSPTTTDRQSLLHQCHRHRHRRGLRVTPMSWDWSTYHHQSFILVWHYSIRLAHTHILFTLGASSPYLYPLSFALCLELSARPHQWSLCIGYFIQ